MQGTTKKILVDIPKKSTKNLALPGAYITAVQRVYIYIYLQVLLSQRITHIRCRNTIKMQQTDSIQQATSVSFSFADTHKHHLMIHSTLTKPVQQKI